MKFQEADVKARMRSVTWIRACCARLLRLDAMLYSQDPKTLVTHLRAFFVVGWDGVNVDACFNTFIHLSEFLEEFMPMQVVEIPTEMHARMMKALANDICANVYAVWIDRLCCGVRPLCSPHTRPLSGRQLSIPMSPWQAAYAKDPLLESLETLYAKYLPLALDYYPYADTMLVRLNGAQTPIVFRQPTQDI
jgi:hypothetical protein